MGRAFLRKQHLFAYTVLAPVETLSVSTSMLLDLQNLALIGALKLSWNVFHTTTILVSVRYLQGDINL